MSTVWGYRGTHRGPVQDHSSTGERPGRAWWRSSSLPPRWWSPHAKLLMSLGPWPALKESRVLKMVMREEGKTTAQAAIKFLGAYGRLWAGPAEAGIPPAFAGLCSLRWEWAGLRAQLGGQLRGCGSQPPTWGAPQDSKTLPSRTPSNLSFCPSLQDLMTQNGISYVLNASNSCPKPDFICESRFMRVPINDSYCEKLLPWLDKSIEFIGEGGHFCSPFLGRGDSLKSSTACWQCGAWGPLPGAGKGCV